jgi:hypothetical protein
MQINSTLKSPAIQLILISALALFTELAIIRWLSSYILYLGYFTNIILIASFFGLGAGALLGQQKKRLFFLFPILLLLIIFLVSILKINIGINTEDQIFFQSTELDLKTPLELIAPVVFILITALFLPLGQKLGSLLNSLPPLKAYTLDIVGSLAGIILFTILSFTGTQPFIWFVLIMIMYLILLSRYKAVLVSFIAFIPVLVMVWLLSSGTIWSPYYKITLNQMIYETEPLDDVGYVLLANSTGHQTLEPIHRKEFIYSQPYELIENPDYENILIIGTGGGSDAAIALTETKASIDAVDIDPTILDIGKQYHPLKPYDSDRITTYVNDGRAFIETTDKKYDLIIFALTDSLTLASSYSNTRLESYLFTLESFESARDHLTDDGLVVLYNFYREPWLVEKLGSMLEQTFAQEPFVMTGQNTLAVLMAGPGLTKLKPDLANEFVPTNTKYKSATDNWPFLYLKKPSLPKIYFSSLLSILVIAFLFVVLINKKLLVQQFHPPAQEIKYATKSTVEKKSLLRRISSPKQLISSVTKQKTGGFHWHFFFLGVGFLLLETKNIINFSLLFGSTWLVNALVFFAILAAVLVANLIAMKYNIVHKKRLYLILGLLLLLNLLIPLKSLLALGVIGRYVLASALTFSPIILANLIFATSFKNTTNASLSFGANLLGAVLGGFLEYSALLIGYHYVLILIGVFYFFSFLSRGKFQLNE